MNSPLVAMPQENTTAKVAPARDLCPVLTTIRLRAQARIAAIDEEILVHAQSNARGDERLVALQTERAALAEALELVATASKRGLDREARIHWLEALLHSAPVCVTRKTRQRLRLLIEGLSETAGP